MWGPVDVERFRARGFTWVRGAVAPASVATLVEQVGAAARGEGVDLDDPATWSRPVVRVWTPSGAASLAAARSPALAEAYDALLGAGGWIPPGHVGGTVPVRFPHPDDPGDAGWHVDASRMEPDGRLVLDVHSRGRGLVCLVLLTDVGPDDAPTEVRVGSHLDIVPSLAPHGPDGVGFMEQVPWVEAAPERPVVALTGRAGDVALVHPFLIHRATWPHRGSRPRMVAQGSVEPVAPFPLDGRPDAGVVEQLIVDALG